MYISSAVPAERVRALSSKNVLPPGEFVLYWMVAARRSAWNDALDRAVDWARALGRPLVVLEALRCDYPYASDRHHRYVLDGMANNAEEFLGKATYLAYLEPSPGAGKGLVEALAARSCVVVTDDSPLLFLRPMVECVAGRIPVLVEAVDSNCILPLSVIPKTFDAARWFRSFIQKEGVRWTTRSPSADPFAGASLPQLASVGGLERWSMVDLALFNREASLETFPIDHSVPPISTAGGRRAGLRALQAFVGSSLSHYGDRKRSLHTDGSSGLSGFLHWGHLSAHEVFAAVATQEGWTPECVSRPKGGIRAGFFGMSEPAETFIDELWTWRELAWSWAHLRPGWEAYETLPQWARSTLEKHQNDERKRYSFEQLRDAQTDDLLWNAAQRQLRIDGRIASYLRMLWGKRIVEWTESPREALHTMLTLNDRYAVDGRDPNSIAGVTWVLGRFDRPWPPEKPVLGTVRPMTSKSTATKMDVKPYLQRYAYLPNQGAA